MQVVKKKKGLFLRNFFPLVFVEASASIGIATTHNHDPVFCSERSLVALIESKGTVGTRTGARIKGRISVNTNLASIALKHQQRRLLLLPSHQAQHHAQLQRVNNE